MNDNGTSRNLWLVVGLALGLAVLGLATRNRGLILLAAPLVIYLGAAIRRAPGPIQVRAGRVLSAERASPGKQVTTRLSVTNEGPALENLLIEDETPAGLECEPKEARKRAALPGAGSLAWEYAVRGGRGSYKFTDLRITAEDPFGLFRAQASLPAPGTLLVSPETVRLQPVRIRPRQTRVFGGPIPARQGGAGTDFFDVRAYQPGDPPRRINWKISARFEQELFTNDMQQERIADVGIILDARQVNDLRTSGGALFDHATQAAGSLAEAFLREGHRVGLLTYGYGMAWVFPGYGKVQRNKILAALAKSETGLSYALENLDRLPTRFFPARSQIVLVSPLIQQDVQPLAHLKAIGYEVLVVSPNRVEFEAQALRQRAGSEPKHARDQAYRIARIERAFLLRRLRRFGIGVVDWRVDRPLDAAIQTALAQQPPGRFIRIGG